MEDAVKFFMDVEGHYDDKLGFESKIDRLKEEASNLRQQNFKSLGYTNVMMPNFLCNVMYLMGK